MTIVHVPQVFFKYFYYLENDVIISNGTWELQNNQI
jgi:hypothetical protein